MFRFLALLLVAIVILAAFTVPSEKKAEAALKDQLMGALAREELGGGRGTAGNLALLGCKLKPQSCYRMVRDRIEAEYDHRWVYSRFAIKGFGKKAECYGAFTTFLCPGGLQDTKG